MVLPRPLGKIRNMLAPFGRLECYLAIDQDVAYLNNYEADTDHFPTVFRQRNLPADYLVVRHTHAHQMET